MSKKCILLYVALLLLLPCTFCQSLADSGSVRQPDSSRVLVGGDAFGFRLGAGSDRSGEISLSWHKSIKRYRLETDLGWASCDDWRYLNLSTTFHFRWNITRGLNWYVGPGVNIGWYFKDYHFGLGVGAQVGLEYNLPIPLQFSLDIFPRYNIFGAREAVGFGGSGAISVRYRF